MCFLAGWDEIIVVHDMLSNKIKDVSDLNLSTFSFHLLQVTNSFLAGKVWPMVLAVEPLLCSVACP